MHPLYQPKNGRAQCQAKDLHDGLYIVEAYERRLAVLDQALVEGLTAEAEGWVMPLEDASARVKAKIRSMAAKE